MLRRYGRTWDGSPLPGVSAADLSPSALSQFRQLAERSGRLDAAALKEPDAALLNKLKLTEGNYLKRATVLLFHPDPLRFVRGAFVKVGYFRTAVDLVYHDEVNGDLFTQVRQTLDLLLSKYLKAVVAYEEIVRVERFPVPREALREAVLNALVHRDYMNTAPIQIRVYEDRLVLWNPAVLPEGWTQQTLLEPHTSQPHNPDIANTFFRAGEIEAWGRGIERMFTACREAQTPEPRIRFNAGGIWTEFVFSPEYLGGLSGGLDQGRAGGTLAETSRTQQFSGGATQKTREKTREIIRELIKADPAITTAELAERIGITAKGVEWQLNRLRQNGLLRRIGPAKGGHWEIIRDTDT